MAQVTAEQLRILAPGVKSVKRIDNLVQALNLAAMTCGIANTPRRLRYFLAQCAHESRDFTRVEESLYYTDPKRVVSIFKSGFDLNRNGVADADEIEFAKGYLRNPEKLANRAYANRFGNGDEASGDGWKYRGSGFIMLTFKDNFRAISRRIYKDDRLVDQPELLRNTDSFYGPAMSAGYFWMDKGLNALADADQFTRVSQIIQGDTSTVKERLDYLRRANALVF
ncbi:lytic enzyme [Pseudomonas phage vB_PaeS_FBPa45]|nr:lytic enzyme [Pseudomonas phage vB_PaeS_FBPa45]